jgi:chemotaxis signal transduction protein
MAPDMREVLLTMRLMDREHTNGLIKGYIQVNGKEIRCMDMDKCLGLMGENILVYFLFLSLGIL